MDFTVQVKETMKTHPTSTHPIVDVNKKPKISILKSRMVQTIAVGLVTVSAISFTSIRIYQSMQPEQYPANYQCLKLSSELPKYYQAQLNTVFGTALPEGSLSKGQVDQLVSDCELHKNEITLKVSK